MKKILLKAGIITIGSLSILMDDIKVYAANLPLDIPLEDFVEKEVVENNMIVEKQELVKRFARVYNMNEDIVLNKVKSIANDFYDSNWYSDEYNNEEEALLYLVKDIKNNSANYDLTSEELKTDKVYKQEECTEDLLEYYCEILGVNKEVALSIVYVECGPALDSANYRVNNNPAGMGPHNSYYNIEHGIVSYVMLLKDSYGCTKSDDSSFFYRIGHIYCVDGTDWAGHATSFYNDIENDYYHYAYSYNRKEKSKELIK